MAVPWTGLNSLLDPNSIIIWEDFEYVVACVREGGLVNHNCTMFEGLGKKVETAARTTENWQRRHFRIDTPPNSKAVGVVKKLAKAVNGVLVENGWGQDIASENWALKQPREECLSLNRALLPHAQKCTVHARR